MGEWTSKNLNDSFPARCRLGVSARIVMTVCLLACPSCDRSADGRPAPSDKINADTPLRRVRVSLATGITKLRIRVDGEVRTGANPAFKAALSSAEWVSIVPQPDGHLRVANTATPDRQVQVEPLDGGGTWLSLKRTSGWSTPFEYPGTIQITANDDHTLDVQNFVDVEQYVACVTAAEVWPTFHDEALRAQSIVSRTYVLYQMDRRRSAQYDIRASQGAQVYNGLRDDNTGRHATKATADTRGLVCTWRSDGQDRLFSTYYSAACGGMSQSAGIFGKRDNIPPLKGGIACDHCSIAPGNTYRWGPVRIDRKKAFTRLAARYPDLSSLGGIADVVATEKTSDGRPIRVRVTGTSGETKEMLAEHFRLAIGSSEIRSTHFAIKVTGSHVVFADGRGFGHGLGLCQWGMQGQALAGRTAGAILKYYFPGSNLTRVY